MHRLQALIAGLLLLGQALMGQAVPLSYAPGTDAIPAIKTGYVTHNATIPFADPLASCTAQGVSVGLSGPYTLQPSGGDSYTCWATGQYWLGLVSPSYACPAAQPGYVFNFMFLNWALIYPNLPQQATLCLYTLRPTSASAPPASYTITLTPDSATIEPSQTLGFTVKVLDTLTGQPPQQPVAIQLSLKVDAKSGGHDHGDSTRPRGSLNGTPCTSDSTCLTLTAAVGNGTARFIFGAEEAAGIHTISARCDACSNSDAKRVEVKVPGLAQIPASQFYALTELATTLNGSGAPAVIGSTAQHLENHYLTPQASQVLWRIAVSYQVEQQFKLLNPATGALLVNPATGFPVAPPVLHLNDASLQWGGKFDIKGEWSGSHAEHQRGTVVDVRANTKAGAIARANFANFDKLLTFVLGDANSNGGVSTFLRECTPDRKDQKGKPPTPKHRRIWPGCVSQLDGSQDSNRHYHLRLMGVAE